MIRKFIIAHVLLYVQFLFKILTWTDQSRHDKAVTCKLKFLIWSLVNVYIELGSQKVGLLEEKLCLSVLEKKWCYLKREKEFNCVSSVVYSLSILCVKDKVNFLRQFSWPRHSFTPSIKDITQLVMFSIRIHQE